MSASPSSPTPSVIITRLRAAGCVFAEDEAGLLLSAARTPAELVAMVDRRSAGLPLEQVLGWAEFCGLRIAVEPGVFVPRRRTEFLVRQAVAVARPPLVAVDMCCGSGAVGAALAAALTRVEVYAVDIDPAAVRCARRNLAACGGQAYEGDLYEPLPVTLQGRVDVLVANAPYVPTEAISLMPPEARLHEPRVALDGGPDGLDAYRALAAQAQRLLTPDGRLVVELGSGQHADVSRLFTMAGLAVGPVRHDLSGIARALVISRMPGILHNP